MKFNDLERIAFSEKLNCYVRVEDERPVIIKKEVKDPFSMPDRGIYSVQDLAEKFKPEVANAFSARKLKELSNSVEWFEFQYFFIKVN